MGSSPIILGSSRDLDSHMLVCVVTNTNAREVKPLGIDTHKQRGALLLMDTTPALAEGTASVESLVVLRLQRALIVRLVLRVNWWRVL